MAFCLLVMISNLRLEGIETVFIYPFCKIPD